MRFLMKKLFTSPMRNLTTEDEGEDEDDYIFEMQSFPGDVLRDSITGVPAVTSISGVRYGIVNGVVTQFVLDQPPIEDDGLRGCTAFPQLAKMSETLTDAIWGKSRSSVTLIGENFRGSAVWRYSETVDTGVHQLFQISSFIPTVYNSVIGLSCVIKSNSRNIGVYAKLKDNTIVTIGDVNTVTGVAVNIRAGSVLHVSPLGDGYYRVFATVMVLTGGTAPYMYIGLLNGYVSSYTGDGVSGVYLSQPILIDFGVGGVPFIPPYVPNNTSGSISVVSEAATATTGTSFDLDDVKLARPKTALRGLSAQGHLEMSLKSNTNSSWLANSSIYNILSVNNTASSLLYVNKDSGGDVTFRTTDGTNIASVSQALTVGTTYKISVDWGTHSTGQKMRITVNGVKSTLVNFTGSFGAQDLRFFYGNTIHAGWIVKDSLKIFERPIW